MSEPQIISGKLKVSSADRLEGNIWHYRYVELDGKRFDNVLVGHYIHDDFRDAQGDTISLSTIPVPGRKFSCLVVALRHGERIERCPELGLGEGLSRVIGDAAPIFLGMAVVLGIAGMILFAVLGVFLEEAGEYVNLSPSSSRGIAAMASFTLVCGWLYHRIFRSKKSVLGNRRLYNAALRALD